MSNYGVNKSFVLRGIEDVTFEDRPVPKIGDSDVLVEVKKTGICGSDVHYLVHGRIGNMVVFASQPPTDLITTGDFIVKSPMVLGHESAGIVAKVGSGVKHLKVGSRVAMEPGQTCRLCEPCKHGKYELCADVVFAATPPYDGTLARYYRIPSDLAYELPENLSLEDGAMMEPLAVGIHSVSTIAQVRTNQTVAVFGAGPVGLLCMAVAKALGARRVIAIDINQERLNFAKSYAASDIFIPGAMKDGESKMDFSRRTVQETKEKLNLADAGPNGVDTVIEATGAEVCIQMGYFLTKAGGTFVQVGMGNAEVQVPITLTLVKELVLKGSFRYGPGDYALAISLVAQGKIDLKPLVTHRFRFEDAKKAFETTRKGKGEDGVGVIKAIISGPE